jgi:alpha-mannosidase
MAVEPTQTGDHEMIESSPDVRKSPLSTKRGNISAARRIYLALDDHTDYMWTANEEDYKAAFLEMLDYYLDLADQTEKEVPEFQSRFNCDGTYWVWVYEKNRTYEQFQRLIHRIQDGHITVPINPLVEAYGGAPLEAILRGMYYAGKLERSFGIKFPLFVPMEDQTLPLGLGALCAGSGVKYAWKGICACASKMEDAWDREHDIYWWVGLDGSRILMKWNSMLESNKAIGGYAEARHPEEAIEFVETNPEFRRRYPYDIIGIFGKGWDDLKTLTDRFVSVAKEQSNPHRQVIVSNEVDFFEDFKEAYGDQLPRLTCAYGNEWDLYIASMAETSAQVKRAVESLRTAEALAALVNSHRPQTVHLPSSRDQVYMEMGLYYEHDWTADSPIISREDRANWSRRLAGSISSYEKQLEAQGKISLSNMIQGGALPRWYAFNPLSWTRTDTAILDFGGTEAFHVVDLSSGEEVPFQVLDTVGNPNLQILAKDVPGLGYKVFEVRPGQGKEFPTTGLVSGNQIENDFYRMQCGPSGNLLSLMDKTLGGREFVRAINGRYLNDFNESWGKIELESNGPVSVTIKVTMDQPLKRITRITLYQGIQRIDFNNEILEGFDQVLTWAYSFNLDFPDTWHEEIGAILRCKLLDTGGHYAGRNARYDWLTLNHFVDMSDGEVGISLSNADCSFMQLGQSTVNYLDDRTSQVKVLAGGQVDGPQLGIPNQGGNTYFRQRFALQPHAGFDPGASMRFALEHQNPLCTGKVNGNGPLPEFNYSFCAINDPDVIVWALKPAEDEAGGILFRLWNLSTQVKNIVLTPNMGKSISAMEVSHLETHQKALETRADQVFIQLLSQQIKSLIVYPG